MENINWNKVELSSVSNVNALKYCTDQQNCYEIGPLHVFERKDNVPISKW